MQEALDAAEALVELANDLDASSMDPVRFGNFQMQARTYIQDTVRMCWALARLYGIDAVDMDKRLIDRHFYKSSER